MGMARSSTNSAGEMPEADSVQAPLSNTERGPIIISRHGRPALNRREGPRLTWRDYIEWWARYEAGSLAEDQSPPDSLCQIVSDAKTVLTSERPRAIETAQLAAPHIPPLRDALFNEAPLPPPKLPGFRYLPKTWNVLARSAWLNGHSLGGESVTDAHKRAESAAERLHQEAVAGKVYLAAHGWFNRMLRPKLRALGWRETYNGGDQYWSYRVYEWRGRS